jgi:protein-tyrosine phosphatase
MFKNILVVCTGNICRSPMAEAMLRTALKQKNAIGFEVSSAGTSAPPGEAASEGGYLVGLEHGLDLSGHCARVLTRELVAES